MASDDQGAHSLAQALMAEKARRETISHSTEVALRDANLPALAGGSSSALGKETVSQLVATNWIAPLSKDQAAERAVASTDALKGVGAEDSIEAMMGAQMVAMHNVTMEMLRLAAVPGIDMHARESHLGNANRLSRTFSALVQTFDRHRGKGQQKVTVEHVHVYEGGQAIVGPVDHHSRRHPTRVAGAAGRGSESDG